MLTRPKVMAKSASPASSAPPVSRCVLICTSTGRCLRPSSNHPPPRESVWDDGAWVVVESATDPVAAARAATSRMIDLLVAHWSLSDVHAYILCSVALHLRLSQVVNEPMFTVSALLPKRILPSRQLF